MDVQLRLLNKEDATLYRDVRLKSFQDDPYAFSESYEDERLRPISDFEAELEILGTPPEWFVLGAFEAEKLVGFVKFRKDLRSKGLHKSMIHAMYVDPSCRGKNVGKVLVEDLISRVRNLENMEQIHLWVLHSQKSVSAANFYKKCGFVSQGPMVLKDLKIGKDYIDAEYMVLYLEG
ncbi:MAG: GNAT family N-acetyltransferase [Cyclobacteriaceae bacterium]